LILNNLDDAFREGKEESRKSIETKILEEKLDQTLGVVSTLKARIDSIKKLSSDTLLSRSPSRFAKKLELNIENMMSESSILKEIREVYNGLGVDKWKQNCLLCFSVFPQNAVIKKKALVHWWVGEGFLFDTTAEEKGNNLFEEFVARGIIERIPKKRRPSSELCKMHPLIRYAVIWLAETNNFTRFHPNGNPTADFSKKSNTRGGTRNFIRFLTNRNPTVDFCEKKNKRGFLVKTEEGYSSLRELTYGFRLKVEKVETLFNVSEPYVDLREDSLSEMKNLKVLQLGRYQESTKQVVEVDDTEFLNDLQKMKRLRYFSLRGITRVTVLLDSICKLTKLIIVDLRACHYLESLPEGIGSLTNLAWLDISGCYLTAYDPVEATTFITKHDAKDCFRGVLVE
jgi:hypothetical protein